LLHIAYTFCTLHTHFARGNTDAVARHVSFAQITCCACYIG